MSGRSLPEELIKSHCFSNQEGGSDSIGSGGVSVIHTADVVIQAHPHGHGRASLLIESTDGPTGFGFQPPLPTPASVEDSNVNQQLCSSLLVGNHAPSLSSAGISLHNLRDGPIQKLRNAEKRQFVARQGRAEVEGILREGFGSPHAHRTSLTLVEREADVLKLVLLREAHLHALTRLLRALDDQVSLPPHEHPEEISSPTNPQGVLREIGLVIARLRGASVEIAEAVSEWRRVSSGAANGKDTLAEPIERFFSFDNENYLLKMVHDLDLLGPSLARRGFAVVTTANPFLIPDRLIAESLVASRDEAWGLRPLPPDLHVRCTAAEHVLQQEVARERRRCLRNELRGTCQHGRLGSSDPSLGAALRRRATASKSADTLRQRQQRARKGPSEPNDDDDDDDDDDPSLSGAVSSGYFITESATQSNLIPSRVLKVDPQHFNTREEFWREAQQRAAARQKKPGLLLVDGNEDSESLSGSFLAGDDAGVNAASLTEKGEDGDRLAMKVEITQRAQAALKIQKLTRGTSCRRLVSKQKGFELEDRRARDAVQQTAFAWGHQGAVDFFRGAIFFMHEHRADESVSTLVLAEEQAAASTLLQKMARARQARKVVEFLRGEAAERKAATKLQATVRGFHARVLRKKWEAETRTALEELLRFAATKIQSRWRVCLARIMVAAIRQDIIDSKDPVSIAKKIAAKSAADAAAVFDSLARELASASTALGAARE